VLGVQDDAWEIEVLGWLPYVEALSIRTVAHLLMGRTVDARHFVEQLTARIRRPRQDSDLSSVACDRWFLCWTMGDAERAQEYASEALRLAERFGSESKIVYALMACGIAGGLGQRWQASVDYLERAQQLIAGSGAGGEWSVFIDPYLAWCLAELGDHQRSIDLVLATIARTPENNRVHVGVPQARALRIAGGLVCQAELETVIDGVIEEMARSDTYGWLPLVLFERAGLARLRGDMDGMTRDLAEARRRLAEMNITGWEDYARSIEA